MESKPTTTSTEEQVKHGLKLVIGDGLAAEAMITLTAFLVAMALLMGALRG